MKHKENEKQTMQNKINQEEKLINWIPWDDIGWETNSSIIYILWK